MTKQTSMEKLIEVHSIFFKLGASHDIKITHIEGNSHGYRVTLLEPFHCYLNATKEFNLKNFIYAYRSH